MLFNPIIVLDDILETISFIRKNNLNKNTIINHELISSSYVIAYPGTPIAKDVQAKNCYSYNQRGYTILDKKSELCFQIMSRWNYEIYNILDMDSIDIQLFDQQINIKSTLFYQDLDLLETVAKLLLQHDEFQSVNDFEDILQTYYKQVYAIKDRLIKIDAIYKH